MAAMLSVIVPTYNRAEYLAGCVQSIETCGAPDVEIVIADDASTDHTSRVLAALGGRVTACRLPRNSGPAAARNRGFQASHGRYVAFLDSDDRWLPGICPRMLDLLDRYSEVGVVFADAPMGNPETGYRMHSDHHWPGPLMQSLVTAEPEPGLRVLDRGGFFRSLITMNRVFIGSAVMRREAVDRVGGFDPALFVAEDWDFWLRLAQHSTFAFSHQSLGVYLQHPGGISKDFERMHRYEHLVLKKVLRRYRGGTPEHRALVRRELRRRLFDFVRQAYWRDEFAEAAGRFRDVLASCGWWDRALFFRLLCSLPPGFIGRLRSAKRVLSCA